MTESRAPRFLAVLLVLAAGAAPAFGRDNTITTDPLAAALMPPPEMGTALFVPSFIRPPGRVFDFEAPLEMQPIDRYPVPGLASRTPQRPVNVLIVSPPDNAVFTRESMVTFGWLPAEQEISEGDAPDKVQFPIRYEIIITRHDNSGARLFVKAGDSKRNYSYLYDPPLPGSYTWYIRAVYNAAMHGITSEPRNFMVLP